MNTAMRPIQYKPCHRVRPVYTPVIVGERTVLRSAWTARFSFFFATGRYDLKVVSNYLLGFTHHYKLLKRQTKMHEE